MTGETAGNATVWYGRETEAYEAGLQAERRRMLAAPAVVMARDYLASDDLTELVRADPPCSREDAMTAIGGFIVMVRMLLKLIEGES